MGNLVELSGKVTRRPGARLLPKEAAESHQHADWFMGGTRNGRALGGSGSQEKLWQPNPRLNQSSPRNGISGRWRAPAREPGSLSLALILLVSGNNLPVGQQARKLTLVCGSRGRWSASLRRSASEGHILCSRALADRGISAFAIMVPCLDGVQAERGVWHLPILRLLLDRLAMRFMTMISNLGKRSVSSLDPSFPRVPRIRFSLVSRAPPYQVPRLPQTRNFEAIPPFAFWEFLKQPPEAHWQ
ncbi:hypothetical protein M440DRAFT_1057781 [Trichoderma longibrachiatum ATCC 18648]|uniref:Uncharacterized protein n=1 Tax=Trichoderma longibrachiatum ATCC 18648 TaxID=983965 RepID=A0A2T4BXP7_TRILO|nr:hypothetical protein M440DRAFT_1057781 [Trichoderma longibrachiatum ATCC 18648]